MSAEELERHIKRMAELAKKLIAEGMNYEEIILQVIKIA